MKLLTVMAALLSAASCYNILCVFPVPSRSHNQLGWGVVDALLKAGHQVTWTTPFPETVKNPPSSLRVIDVSATRQYSNDVDMSQPKMRSTGISFVKAFSANVTKEVLANPEVRDVIINIQYDAVFTEAFFSDVQAGIAAVQRVPWLLLSAMPLSHSLEAQLDEVRSLATAPNMFNDCGIPMGFTDRLYNTFLYIAMTVAEWLDRTPTNNLYKTLFAPLAKARGMPLPPFSEAVHNVSILFVNSHESISPALSTPPNVVNIAGYHIDENIPPLPKDLQDLLDNSPQGVVYFSMGSVLRSSALAAHTREALLAHFARLDQTVLWKFEADVQGLPANVHVRPWMPQSSILAHPNVRVFITHGGIFSTLEAVKAGVPLLAVPVFGDQPANAERAVRAGFARRASFSEHMAGELAENLMEMLTNDSYYNKVREMSRLFLARVAPPTRLIAHYTELAIETKGAYHLRSLSHQYSWYQRWMLDQLAFVLVVLVIIVELGLISIRICANVLTRSDSVKEKQN